MRGDAVGKAASLSCCITVCDGCFSRVCCVCIKVVSAGVKRISPTNYEYMP